MQRDHGLPLRLRGQGPLQPGEPRGAERTMRLAGDHTIQQHQTDGKILNGVLDKTFIVAQAGQMSEHFLPPVMIAGNEETGSGARRARMPFSR